MGESAAALVLDAREEYLVPDERSVAMIRSCVRRIGLARTLPDVKVLLTQAEAVDAVVRKLRACDEVKRASLEMLVAAEQQLGRISRALPQAKRGGYAQKHPGQIGKRQILREHGEAIDLLERVSSGAATAHPGTVAEMRGRLATLSQRETFD